MSDCLYYNNINYSGLMLVNNLNKNSRMSTTTDGLGVLGGKSG